MDLKYRDLKINQCAKIYTTGLRCFFFLGVIKYATNLAVRGDCGWVKPQFQCWIMCRHWNRLVTMDNNDLLQNISFRFRIVSRQLQFLNKKYFSRLNVINVFENVNVCNLSLIATQMKHLND